MDSNNEGQGSQLTKASGFFARFLESLARDFMRLVFVFMLGSVGGAIVCLYYGFPLVYSVFGGIIIFALATALFITS